MTNLATILAASLLGHGVPAPISDTMRLEATDAGQGVITVGYERKGRRSVVAQILAPTLQDAVAILADRERVAGILSQGLRAMPASVRPDVPGWIADSVEARRADAMRARVTCLARGAALATAQDACDLPWAA